MFPQTYVVKMANFLRTKAEGEQLGNFITDIIE